MSIEWSGLAPALLLPLDRELAQPLRLQLEGHLREAIRAGRLQPGERLPSSRELARKLGVSRGLVLECYAQLRAEGYVAARAGSATRVAVGACEPAAARFARPASRRPLAVDFRPGVPDLSSFPRREWAWALREACRRASTAELDYGDPRGAGGLRQMLASYLRRVRAAVCAPERIVICTGFAQGLNLVLRALAQGGVDRVAVEDPGDLYHSSVSRRTGVEAVPVPVDSRGISVEALTATGAGAVVLTPAHQSPTGVVLAPERRHALVAWAAERDAIIIEDDYDAEFRYDREPVGALQGLAPDRAVLLTTVSKSLAPALRLGWIVSPPSLVDAIAEEKRLNDRGSPALDQIALALLIESGRYDRHLRRMRAVYARRRHALARTLAEQAPDVELHGAAAGFHAVARLPSGAGAEETIVAAARARSIGLYGMGEYRANGETSPPELVLGFGNLSEESVERGITAIGDLLRG